MSEVVDGAPAPVVPAPITEAPAPEAKAAPEAEAPPPAPKTYTEDEVKALRDAEAAKIRNKYERKMERQRIEAETRAKVAAEQQQKPDSPAGKPTPDQFNDYAQYLEALAEFKAGEILTRRETEKANKETQERQQSDRARTSERQTEMIEAGEAKYADFEDVVKSDKTQYSQAAFLAMLESDLSHDIAYHLAKNQDEAKRIAALPAYAQAKEIGKLEDKLSAKPTKKPSNAPEPIKPVGGGNTPHFDPKTASIEDLKTQFKAGGSHRFR